jgi:hypothetical protein
LALLLITLYLAFEPFWSLDFFQFYPSAFYSIWIFFILFGPSTFNCSIYVIYIFLDSFFLLISSLSILLHLFFNLFFVLILLIAIFLSFFYLYYFFNFIHQHLISFGFLYSFGPHSFNNFLFLILFLVFNVL